MRSDWNSAPLADKLANADKRFTILNFDLREHGDSKPPEKDKKDAARFDADVVAAIAHIVEVTQEKVPRVVLVGSSFRRNARSSCHENGAQGDRHGVAFAWRGHRGLDVYEPYAEVRHLPTFISGGVRDNVSLAPVDSLSKMAKQGTVKQYPARGTPRATSRRNTPRSGPT